MDRPMPGPNELDQCLARKGWRRVKPRNRSTARRRRWNGENMKVPPIDLPRELLGDIPLNKEQSYERALGRLAMSASLLHIMIEHFAWRTWSLSPHHGMTLTGDLPAKQLIIKLKKTIKQVFLDEKARKKITDLLDSAEKLNDRRNELLHAIWTIEEGKPSFCYMRKRNNNKDMAPSVEEIDFITDSIYVTASQLIRFEEEQKGNWLSPIGLGLQMMKKRN
jgi:hypothetical protein